MSIYLQRREFIYLQRGEFIAGLGGVAAWPIAAQAQQPRLPVVGYIGLSNGADALAIAAFRRA